MEYMEQSTYAIRPLQRKSNKVCCPVCGEKLGGDKDPVVSEGGFIYRKRTCLSCRANVRTKQGKEEITHVESADGTAIQ